MSVMNKLREARAEWSAKRDALEAIRNGAWDKVNGYRGVELTEEEYCFLKRTYDDHWWMSDDSSVLRRGQRVDDALEAAVNENPDYKKLDYSDFEHVAEYPVVPHHIWNNFRHTRYIHDKLLACDIQKDEEVDDFCKMYMALDDICSDLPWRDDEQPPIGLESRVHLKKYSAAAYLKLHAKGVSDVLNFQHYYGKLAPKYGNVMHVVLELGKERIEALGKRDGKVVSDFAVTGIPVRNYYIVV